MATEFTYSIADDTANGALDSRRLHNEIAASAIVTALDRVDTSGDVISVYFKASLSSTDEDILDGLVEDHTGEPYVEHDIVKTEPFADKKVGEKRLFQRTTGVSQSCAAESTTNIDFVVPYDHAKINGASVINCEPGDYVNFKVFDTPTGSLSGYPNVQLNQFAFNVQLPKDFYLCKSMYDADLIKNLKIRVEYYNASSSAKTIGVNYYMHEVKD